MNDATNSISCPVCQNLCSTQAVSCPKCGHPFARKEIISNTQKIKTTNPQTWKILTLAIGVIAGGLITFALYRAFFIKPQTSNNSLTEIATTNNENKTINLKNDFQNSIPVSTPEPIASLSLEAALVYSYGGVQPVAREKFYLLDDDLNKILSKAGVKAREGLSPSHSLGFAVAYPEVEAETLRKSLAAIRPHILYTLTTDFQGKGKFEGVKVNSYYLFGVTKTRRAFALWNMKLNVKEGQNEIVLDGNNVTAGL
jgi:hypothetical protein